MATFLVVVLSAWRMVAHMEGDTRGLDVVLAHDCSKLSSGAIYDNRSVVLQLRADGSLRLNAETVEDKDIIPLMVKIFSPRQEKVVYLLAEDDVPYSRFVEMADRLVQGVSDLYIAMTRDLGPERFQEQACFNNPLAGW